MSMVGSLHERRQELKQLDQWREQLAARLVDAAHRLDSPGEPPTDALIDELDSYRARTLQLAEHLDVIGASSDQEAVAGITLPELGRLLDDRERRERVLPVLDEVLRMRHVETVDFAPLADCQAEARRLLASASQPSSVKGDADLDAICQQTHPLNLLLKLCEHDDGLSDSDWIECNDRVTAVYGRQLATAVARGRIQRVADSFSAATDPVPDVTPTNEDALPLMLVPSDLSFRPIALPPELPAVSQAIQEPAPARRQQAPLGADSIFEPSPLADSVFDERTPPPKLRGLVFPTDEQPLIEPPPSTARLPGNAINGPARVVPSVDGTDARMPSSPVADLVVQLLSEDRLPLAMHVARCAELRPGLPVPFPSTWLLRSLILGGHLSDSNGELARQLEDDLRHFRPELLTEGDADRRVASGFLLRAAALPAALIAGSASASVILRAFKIAPGCSQLYNYCSRIALYGDRLDGQIVEMFRPQLEEIEDIDTESLGEAASRWLQETARKAINYGRTSLLFLHAHWTLTSGTSLRHSDATQVWCKWQETLLLASRLLRPVCRNLEGERHWVRQEIARLSAHLRAEANDTAQRNGSSHAAPARNNSLPTDEMHAVLRQAIELAGRWLRLSGAKSALAGPLSQDALDLRDEVLQRTAGVLSELNEQWQAHSSPLVRAGIACCQRSVERIHSLFAESRSLPLQEIDLRHAFHAELLKIPGLELNDQWLPETDPATLERELIEHWKRGDTSWPQAYNVHALHGDHVATGRLLELDVWPSEAERGELSAQRSAQIAEHRQTLASELNEVSLDLEAIGRLGQLDGVDGDVFAQRLERLRRDLPGLLNFGSCRWQLDQIRSALQRRRIRPLADGGLAPSDWSPANLERRRSPTVNAAVSDRADKARARGTEAVAMVTDIFSEE
ncbi:MAG: hypothetical protein AABP62_19230 [Planctomycetota bacterium]